MAFLTSGNPSADGSCSGRDSFIWNKQGHVLCQFDLFLFPFQLIEATILIWKMEKNQPAKHQPVPSHAFLTPYKCVYLLVCWMSWMKTVVSLSASWPRDLATRVRLALSLPCWLCRPSRDDMLFVGHWGQTVSNYQLHCWSSCPLVLVPCPKPNLVRLIRLPIRSVTPPFFGREYGADIVGTRAVNKLGLRLM